MFSFTHDQIDREAVLVRLRDESAGALCVFEGWVRNHNEGRPVDRLEYEAYEPLGKKEAEAILAEAGKEFGLTKAVCLHRLGRLSLGDMAVIVAVTAAHRGEAFSACRYIIDEIKMRLPIWKKEHYTDGTSEWVNCRHAEEPHASPAHTAGGAR